MWTEYEIDMYNLDGVFEAHDIEYSPTYWAMLFDFGRALVKKDRLIASNWRGIYHDYLQSVIWKAKAFDAKEKAGNKCEQCGSPYSLQVHHKTYDRVGKESPDDLITLCSSCHYKFHKEAVNNDR